MLTNERRDVVVSSLGWIDHGSLWAWSVGDSRPSSHEVSAARHLTLHAGRNDHFAVLHHFDEGRLEVTVHDFRTPPEVVAGVRVAHGESARWGDDRAWGAVPAHYVTHYSGSHWSDYCLIRLLRPGPKIELQQLSWHGSSYDPIYQGVVGVVEVPDDDRVILSIQRDSNPLLYDPITQSRVGRLKLGDRGGNPTLRFSRLSSALWAVDYDTLLRLESGSWKVVKSRLLQEAVTGARHFIGDFWIHPQESELVLARPFSGDVLSIDPLSLRPRRRCWLGSEPLVAAALADDSVIARDWKTGSLLRGDWD